MIAERAKECLAMMMIGDGVLAMLEPRRHMLLWEEGPSWWRAMVEPFANRPTLTRCVGAGELALGVWLASRQTPNGSAHA
jgi:hypothetical protein